MSQKRRLERVEERLNLGKERRILTVLKIDAGKADLPSFPYEDCEDCKSYRRQIKELEKEEPDRQVWIVTLGCKDCKEDCEFVGKAIGVRKGKNES